MAMKVQGGRMVPAATANKAKMSQAITALERAIEQARQAASEMMAMDGPGLSSSSYHIKDMQRELQSMNSGLSMLRSSLNSIK